MRNKFTLMASSKSPFPGGGGGAPFVAIGGGGGGPGGGGALLVIFGATVVGADTGGVTGVLARGDVIEFLGDAIEFLLLDGILLCPLRSVDVKFNLAINSVDFLSNL
jgi:hypothetical protein